MLTVLIIVAGVLGYIVIGVLVDGFVSAFTSSEEAMLAGLMWPISLVIILVYGLTCLGLNPFTYIRRFGEWLGDLTQLLGDSSD